MKLKEKFTGNEKIFQYIGLQTFLSHTDITTYQANYLDAK